MQFKALLIKVIDHLLYRCPTLHHNLLSLSVNLRNLVEFRQVNHDVAMNHRLFLVISGHVVGAQRSFDLKFLVVPATQSDQPLQLRVANDLDDVEAVKLRPPLGRFLLRVVWENQVDLLSEHRFLWVRQRTHFQILYFFSH